MKKHFFLRTLCLVLSLLLLALPLASCDGEDTPSGGSGQGGSGTVGGSGDGSGDAHTHTLTAVDEIAPTCKKEGVKAHYHCNGCNKDFLDAAGKQETDAAGLTLSRVSHDYKDGFCRYCDQADPSDRTLSDATRLTSVSVTQNGLISFSKLKVASKYVLTLTLADGERKFEITKEKAAFSLADLPEGAKLSYGRNAMTITVYEREEIEIEGEKGYQDVPLWSGKYALVSLREGYEVLPLRYEDDLISLEGFYGEKRTGNNSEYLLSEVTLPENNKKVYPTLRKDLKVKKAGYTAVIYQTAQGREEGTGQISIFTTPLSDTKQYYYVRVFDENNQPAGDYDLVLRGVTYLQVEMAVETSEKDAEGDRLYQFDYKINSLNNIRFLQGDYMDLSPLFEKIPEGYFLRDNNWNLYEPGKDYLLSSDARGVQEFFAAPAETLRAEAAELALYTDLFQLTRTKWQKNGVPDGNYLFGFSLRLKEDHAYGDLRVPAKILGNRVLLSASSFSWLTVTRVVLEPGFTQLPEKLFFYTEGLTYVAIPASVTSVGDFMFPKEQAGKLKIYCEGRISSDSQWNQVSGTYDFFPTYYNQAGVCSAAEVGDYTLRLEDEKLIVTGLKNTNPGPLPEKAKIGVREYPVTGFADNSLSALTAFEIPAFITEMNFAAFGSGLETLTVAEGNPVYSAFGNLLFNKEATEVLFIPQSVTELTFPLTFTEIGESAFENNKAITAVTLPAGCTTIGKNAFNGCTALQSVTLNNALTEIGENAFRGCTALQSVTFKEGLESIGSRAFSGCTALSELSFPASLKTIGEYTFYNCGALQNITFKEGLESIGSYAFSGCTALSELSFPASLKTIGEYAFYNCGALQNITFKEGLESIGSYAFSGCTALSELSFPDSLQEIGQYAFEYCNSLRRVIFGTGVSGYTLDNAYLVFSYCHRLVEIINPASSRLGSPSTVLGVYSSKDEPTHIRRVGDYLFFEGENEYCLIDYVGSETVLNLPESYQGHTYKIAAYAFEGRNLVTDITISDGVTEIKEYAFNELGALKTVALGNGVKRVRENAFRACYKLTTVALGNSVTRIEKEAFYSCTKLATFTGGDSLQNFYVSALKGTAFIRNEDNWEDDFLYLGHCLVADRKLSNTRKVKDGTLYISDGVFVSSHSSKPLTEVILPEGLLGIGDKAFYGCAHLSSINLPDSLLYLGDEVFYGCTRLCEITLPAGLVTVGADVVGSSSNRNSHIIYVKAAAPGENWHERFAGNYPVIYSCETNNRTKDGTFYVICDGLRFRVKDGKAALAAQFCNSTEWNKSIAIPDTLTVDGTEYPVTAIDDYAFYDPDVSISGVMPTLKLGKNIETIGNYAFYDCSITKLDFNVSFGSPSKLTRIGKYAFYRLQVTDRISFPSSLQEIGDFAFAESKLEEVSFSVGLTHIGKGAFNNSNLKSATFIYTNYWEISDIGRISPEIMSNPTDATLLKYLKNYIRDLYRRV